jgi:hypothetical protein
LHSVFFPKNREIICYLFLSAFRIASLHSLWFHVSVRNQADFFSACPVFFPCKNPRYNAKLAYHHPPRCQKIKLSIYCWLSLDIMPISYVIRQWFYRSLLFLQGHYNEGFYMERKRNLIISWRYASLAMNRGEIKRGFTVYSRVDSLITFAIELVV